MNNAKQKIWISEIDEKRFDTKIARASEITESHLAKAMEFCQVNRVSLLVARCSTNELASAQAMESAGFLLMDTLVYYKRSLVDRSIPEDPGEIRVRPIRPGEEEAVRAVAADSFRGYYGHYHADPRLDRATCDEVYTSWALRSCTSKEVADQVLVAVEDSKVLAFITIRLDSRGQGETVLSGVAPAAHRRGIYRSLMIRSMAWCKLHGAEHLITSTQLNNTATQKVWVRLGFEPHETFYTFHKWFECTEPKR